MEEQLPDSPEAPPALDHKRVGGHLRQARKARGLTLAELSDYPDIAGVLGAQREIAPLLPELFVADGQTWLSVPGDKEYPL